MSNNGLGDATGPTRTKTVEADATVSAGDALAINQSAAADRYPGPERGIQCARLRFEPLDQ